MRKIKNLKNVYNYLLAENSGNEKDLISLIRSNLISDGISDINESLLSHIVSLLNHKISYEVNIINNSEDIQSKNINFSINDLINYTFLLLSEGLLDNFKSNLEKNLLAAKLFKAKQSMKFNPPDNDNANIENIASGHIRKNKYNSILKESNDKSTIDLILESNNLTDFRINYLTYFYSLLSNNKINSKPDEPATGFLINQNIFNAFKLFLRGNTNAHKIFSISLGTLFEEIFRACAKAGIQGKPVQSFLLDFDLELDKYKQRKIAIALMLILNNKFNQSEIHASLKKSNEVKTIVYENDFKNLIMNRRLIDEINSPIENIVRTYRSLINVVNEDSVLVEDIEKDSLFNLTKYKTNCPFDFIIRDKHFGKEDKNYSNSTGFFDLKVSSSEAKSSPIKTRKTGANSNDSGCLYILDIIEEGKKINDDFEIKFLGLVQIQYKLEFTGSIGYNVVEIIIDNVSHIIGNPVDSILNSITKDDFKISGKEKYSDNQEIDTSKLTVTNDKNLNYDKLRKMALFYNAAASLSDIYKGVSTINERIKSKSDIRRLKIFFIKKYMGVIKDLRDTNMSEELLKRKYYIDDIRFSRVVINNVLDKIKNDTYSDPIVLFKYLYDFCFDNDVGSIIDNSNFTSHEKHGIKRSFTICIFNIFSENETSDIIPIIMKIDDRYKNNKYKRISEDGKEKTSDEINSINKEPIVSKVIRRDMKEEFKTLCEAAIKDNMENIEESLRKNKKLLVEVYSFLFK